MKNKFLSLETFIIAMLLAAFIPHMPRAYYTLLRLAITGYAVFRILRMLSAGKADRGWIIAFVVLGLIYNPIMVFGLKKSLWSIVNVATVGFLVYVLIGKKEGAKGA